MFYCLVNAYISGMNTIPVLSELMSRWGIKEFDLVRIYLRDGTALDGVVLPRPGVGDPNVLILKLDNGYNVGIHASNIEGVEVKGHVESKSAVSIPIGQFVKSESTGLPRVRLVATGGTIMSKVDYRTGAVYPSFSLEDLYAMYPEVKGIADIELLNLMAIFSEDMTREGGPRLPRPPTRRSSTAFLESSYFTALTPCTTQPPHYPSQSGIPPRAQ